MGRFSAIPAISICDLLYSPFVPLGERNAFALVFLRLHYNPTNKTAHSMNLVPRHITASGIGFCYSMLKQFDATTRNYERHNEKNVHKNYRAKRNKNVRGKQLFYTKSQEAFAFSSSNVFCHRVVFVASEVKASLASTEKTGKRERNVEKRREVE